MKRILRAKLPEFKTPRVLWRKTLNETLLRQRVLYAAEKSVSALKMLAVIFVFGFAGCGAGARRELITDIEVKQDKVLEYYNLGVYHHREGDYLEARRYFQEMLMVMGVDANVDFEDISEREDYREEIVREYISRLEPKLLERSSSIKMQLERGRALYDAGHYRTALEYFANILVMYPSHTEAIEYSLLARRRLREEEERIEEERARREAERQEREISELYETGLRMYEEGNLVRAREELEEVLRRDPQYREAEEYYSEIGEILQDTADSKYRRGLEEYSAGQVENAISLWKEALRLVPGHSRSHRALERARMRLE